MTWKLIKAVEMTNIQFRFGDTGVYSVSLEIRAEEAFVLLQILLILPKDNL